MSAIYNITGGSDGKEPACYAGDLGLIPRLERSPRRGHGNPLQHSCLEWGIEEWDMTERLSTQHTAFSLWASLVAQLVKNPPAVQETSVRFLGRGIPLAKG